MFPRISRRPLVPLWLWLAGSLIGGPRATRAAAVPAEDPFAAGVRVTEPLPPVEQRARFQLPPGFEIQLVATEPEINKPMNLAFDATGRLWVTTSIEYPWAAPTNRPGRDRLMIFADFGPDGRARKVTTFADGLNIPIGVYPFRGPDLKWKAVVWSIPYIWLLEDTDGDDRADRRTILYGPFDTTRDTHGNQASFRRGWDGWLYATHGFNNDSHVTARDGSHVDLNSGNTYRIRLDGSRIEHHTHGQVNPFGLAWDPWGDLYSSDCHSAPVYQLLGGGYYPSFGKPHDGLGFAPTMIEHAHGSTAIDGLVYVADDLWPAEYQDHVFIGNVMTSRLNHDRLEWLGATPRAVELPDFLTTTDPWFRPVDNCFGPDGALYVADFYNRIIGHYEVPLTHPGRDRERGRLWRVIPTAHPLRPAALADDMPGLIGELGSGSLTRRMLAGATLVDRYGSAAVPGLQAVLAAGTNRYARIHAASLLPQLGVELGSESDGVTAWRDPDPQRRAHGLRILTEAAQPTPAQLARVRQLLADPEARVVRRAAEALGRHPAFENLAPLLQLRARVPVADTHLTYVVRKALRDHLLNEGVLQRVLATETAWSAADNRVFADVLLAVPSAGAGTFFLRHLPELGLAPADLNAVLTHAARHVSAAELPQLASYARKHFANNPRAQLTLFNSVDQGLRQRGLPLPESVRSWGVELVTQLIERPEGSAGWHNLPLEIAATANPWDFEERAFADGERGRVMSSLPGGEGLTGRLRSPVFTAPASLSFWACGHDGDPSQSASGRNVFRLIADDTGDILRQAAPPRSDTAVKIVWNLADLAGRPVHFEVVDAHTGSAYAWVAVGRVETSGLGFPSVGLRTVATEMAAVSQVAIRLGLTGLAPKFEAMAIQKAADSDVRVASARAAVALAPESAVPRLAALLGEAAQPAPFREGIGVVLAEAPSGPARTAVLAAFKGVADRVQQRWAGAMVGSHDGAEAFLQAVAAGAASPRLLQVASLRSRLLAAKPEAGEARVSQLTRDLPPADATREALINARRQAYHAASATTRPADGREVFAKNCAPCHRLGTLGALVGPQLDGIGNRGLDRLCEDILDPNRNVDHAFYTTTLTLRDGETATGLFRREEGELIVLANGAGQEFTVAKRDLKQRTDSPVSPMPDNFGDALPEESFHALLSFLLSQTGR